MKTAHKCLLLTVIALLIFTNPLSLAAQIEQVDLNLPDGFQAERVYEVPNRQGSWVSLTTDPLGRLIASDQHGSLYRIDARGPKAEVEQLDIKMGFAHGLLYAFDSLYVVTQPIKFPSIDKDGKKKEIKKPAGLYRLRDTNGDDQFDTEELLREFPGRRGEHGPHAVILGPDKKSLYICAGNYTDTPSPETSRVPRVWQEDQLTPRLPDPRGHAAAVMSPGGWICKTDPEGKEFELVSSGFRNPYDIAFDINGELFTFDADMEWDIGLPWYRPTRVCHVTSGSEFGWRNGSGKWPTYFADSLPGILDIGPGSPTGICFGTNSNYPAEYRDSLFIGDWSYGIIYRVELEADGATYRGTKSTFCTSPALPVTDLAFNPKDGALYFLTGGRRSQSSLYRVAYTGAAESTTTETVGLNEAGKLRRKIEALRLRADDPAIVDEAWSYLGHEDRFIRFAARTAIELAKDKSWYDKAFAETATQAKLEALTAVARTSDDNELQEKVITALADLDFASLSEMEKLHLLRTYSLAFIRMGDLSEASKQALEGLEQHFPAQSELVNRELSRLFAATQSEKSVPQTMALLEAAKSQQSKIHYANVLHSVTNGWTDELRERYLNWFVEAGKYAGGNSFRSYLENIRSQFAGNLSDELRKELDELINAPISPINPTQQLVNRPVVKQWTMDDFKEISLKNRDVERGKELFAVAQCFSCHAINGEGGNVGPNLTNAGRRFSKHDLLETIVNPDKAVSDQYQATIFQLIDGRTIVGRVANRARNEYMVQEDMLRPGELTKFKVDDIEEMRVSSKSLMPSGLLDTLTLNDILDLMAYMQSTADEVSTR